MGEKRLASVEDLIDLAALCWLAQQEAVQQHITPTSVNDN